MPVPNQSPSYRGAQHSKQIADLALDITAYVCPMTFVRTRLALDRLRSGQTLAVRLSGEEPRTNIPKTAIEQGHQVIERFDNADGTTTLYIRKS